MHAMVSLILTCVLFLLSIIALLRTHIPHQTSDQNINHRFPLKISTSVRLQTSSKSINSYDLPSNTHMHHDHPMPCAPVRVYMYMRKLKQARYNECLFSTPFSTQIDTKRYTSTTERQTNKTKRSTHKTRVARIRQRMTNTTERQTKTTCQLRAAISRAPVSAAREAQAKPLH